MQAAFQLYAAGGIGLLQQLAGSSTPPSSSPTDADAWKQYRKECAPLGGRRRTAVITGAGGGIGAAVAESLAVLGYDLFLGAHSASPAAIAALTTRIRTAVLAANAEGSDGGDGSNDGSSVTIPMPSITVAALDLGSFASIRTFANSVREAASSDNGGCTHAPIGLLVCNAGVMLTPFTLTREGYEEHFGVNALGHLLLQLHLLPALAKAGSEAGEVVMPNNNDSGSPSVPAGASCSARIINLGSIVHHCCHELDFEWLDRKSDERNSKESNGKAGHGSGGGGCAGGKMEAARYSAHAAYARSKLAVAMVSAELARRLEAAGAPVEVATVHPGIVDTHLYRHVNCLLLTVQKVLAPLLFLSPHGGARCIINAGVVDRNRDEGGRFQNGTYYHLMEPAPTSAVAADPTVQQKLMHHCIAALGGKEGLLEQLSPARGANDAAAALMLDRVLSQ